MMTLLTRYLAAVNNELPTDKRADIIRELKANILDEVEARTQGGESTDQALQLVIEKYGDPVAVAQTYAPQAALVAGEDMPLYKLVLLHGAALLFVVSLIQTLSAMLAADSLNPIRLILQTLGNFIQHAALFLLALTLCFYFLGKGGVLAHLRHKNWSLTKLPAYPQAKISISDTLTDIVSSSFVLLLLWTSLWMSETAQQGLLFSLSPSSEHWRFIITIISAASLLFAFYRLTQRTWQQWSLLTYIGEHAVFTIAFLWMASVPTLIVVSNLDVSENWPIMQFVVTQYFSHFLVATALIIGLLGFVKLRQYYQLK